MSKPRPLEPGERRARLAGGPCRSVVFVSFNPDGSLLAYHPHRGSHGGIRHPVTPEEVIFLD